VPQNGGPTKPKILSPKTGPWLPLFKYEAFPDVSNVYHFSDINLNYPRRQQDRNLHISKYIEMLPNGAYLLVFSSEGFLPSMRVDGPFKASHQSLDLRYYYST